MTCPTHRPPALQFHRVATLQQAAIHGLGAAILPLFLIEQDVSDNRLTPIFGPPTRAHGACCLVWPKGHTPRAPDPFDFICS